MPNARPRCAMIAKKKKMYQIAYICSSKIIMHQYCGAVSLGWPYTAIDCSSSTDEESSAVSTSCLPNSGIVPELEVGSASVLPPLPKGLLPLFSEVNIAELTCMQY